MLTSGNNQLLTVGTVPAPNTETEYYSLEEVRAILGDLFPCLALVGVPPLIVCEGDKTLVRYNRTDIDRCHALFLAIRACMPVVSTGDNNTGSAPTPIYDSKQVQAILGVGETTLRKLRNDGWLTYHQFPGSDKIWYTNTDVMEFLNHEQVLHKFWK